MAGAVVAMPPPSLDYGDVHGNFLLVEDLFLSVYAAGGGKRNMPNQARASNGTFLARDIYLHLNLANIDVSLCRMQLFVCRFASSRGEWMPKAVPTFHGQDQLKLVPEWFKARFWDNKQEKKHPWFMFTLRISYHDNHTFVSSQAFPVHQYYPTGPKKTDPNEANCQLSLQRILSSAPLPRVPALHVSATDEWPFVAREFALSSSPPSSFETSSSSGSVSSSSSSSESLRLSVPSPCPPPAMTPSPRLFHFQPQHPQQHPLQHPLQQHYSPSPYAPAAGFVDVRASPPCYYGSHPIVSSPHHGLFQSGYDGASSSPPSPPHPAPSQPAFVDMKSDAEGLEAAWILMHIGAMPYGLGR